MRSWSSTVLSAYTGLFLIFMFAPLALLVAASFNDVSPPSVIDWRGFTTKWYTFFFDDEAVLREDQVLRSLDRDAFVGCLGNSFQIATIVTPLALLFGLAGAVMLTRWRTRFNGVLWWVLLSPILAPGVILGLSAFVFYDNATAVLGVDPGAAGVNEGIVSISIAMITYVSSFAMLIIMARLQRQPVEHEEAARDLGAGPFRVFRRITLPFLAPALFSAAVITFMATIENYNTTFFASGGRACTFATHIGSMVRQPAGHPPIINAVGTVIIVITILAATAFALAKRSEQKR